MNNPTQDAYGGETVIEVPTAQNVQSDTGTLPFTGAEAGIFTAIGLMLIVAGLAGRRLASRNS